MNASLYDSLSKQLRIRQTGIVGLTIIIVGNNKYSLVNNLIFEFFLHIILSANTVSHMLLYNKKRQKKYIELDNKGHRFEPQRDKVERSIVYSNKLQASH